MKKIILIILLASLFLSCRSSKDTTIIKDSIKESTQLNIVKSGFNLISFKEPCDEFGNLRPLFYKSSSGGLKTTITDDNGSILISQEQKQDTIFKEKLVYKDKIVLKDKLVEVPYIPKWALYSLGLNTLLLVWIFRKPLIKLIKPF